MTTTSVATLAELKTALAAAATNGQADIISLTADISAVNGADFTAGAGGRDLVKIAITDGQTLSIVGGGFTLDANYFGRVLEVSSGTVVISDLTIREGGLAGDGFEGQANGGAALGAGIYNSANLTLTNVSVTLNAASGGGGGYGGAYGGGGGGGGGAGSVAGKGGNGASTTGYAASGGTGGAGGPGNYYPTTDGGGGGSSQGGAGGLYGSARAGAGGTAQAGLLSVGGGGGGAGGGRGFGRKGGAARRLAASTTAPRASCGSRVARSPGTSARAAAAARRPAPGGDAAGGIAVGGLWNAGYLSLDSVTLSGNAAGGGFSAADGHTDSYANSHSTGVVNSAPTGSVAISGTSAQGQVLTASNTLADVNGLGTISYQWKSDGGVIGAATGSTFTLTQAYVGHVITVTGSYTDSLGQAESVTSSGTTSVANVNDAPTGSVSIAGTATQGQVLTASNTLADLDGLGTISYQWKSDGAAISGATSATFTLTQAQVGHAVTVVAGYADGFSQAESVTSSATSLVANINDAPTGAIAIAGTATQGQTLTASNTLTDVDGVGTISYQWMADGVSIGGATASTLALAAAQVGKAISVVASYVDGQGTAESATSAATAVVVPVIVEPDPEPETPPTTTTSAVVDGVTVGVVTVANVDGSVTRTMTIPTVLTTADGQADIPLLSLGGQTVLAVSAPSGFGLTVDGSPTPTTAAASASDMVRAVSAHSNAADQSQLIASSQAYLATLPGATPVIVQSLTLSLTAQAATAAAPLIINGSPAVAGGPVTLLIIDARGLPSGAILELHNVDFASISGAVRVTGGTGSQTVFGDNSAQYIVLGADDDVLHGGGGNDTIGSKGGNDKLYGDAGDDTLFGGAGDDLMDGGTGYDTVLLDGKITDYHFTHSSTGMRIFGFEGDDAIVNIEALKAIDGQIVTKLADLVDGATSVAVLTYQFFTGKTPTGAGLDFLLHAPDTVNAHDLTDAYYQGFSLENRYINFAVNLASAQGQGHAWFEQAYGGLNMSQTVAKAYLEIFGAAATSQKVDTILLADVGGQTRQAYFEAVAGTDGSAKAAVIGWLLGEAAKSDLGRYAEANNAFLADFMDGSAHLNVDLIGTYGSGATWIL